MLDRLAGLETEYATLLRLPRDQHQPPSRGEVFASLCAHIARRIPTAPGRFDDGVLFLANGGAYSLESHPLRSDVPGGLIEGATAEARSPSQLVQCQRAQDRMLAEAAAECDLPGRVTIVKNSCDAHGHVYGCQENYEAPVASGVMLLVYRALVLLVLPLALVYWVTCLSVLAVQMAGILSCIALRRIIGGQRTAGPPIEPEPTVQPELSPRMLAITAVLLRLVSLPVAGLLYGICRTIAFRRQRKYLASFLVSRVVLTGAGHVDRSNRFRLSSKAMAIDAVMGFGGFVAERPIFVFHHWLRQMCGRPLVSIRSIADLFRRQQRLQIGLSDSNVSDTAEFLKVGTTSLVLDMIEAGGGGDLPRILRPVEALHRIASDWNLVSRVETTRGQMSGLDIQRAYLRACQRFASAQPGGASGEVALVLRRWEQTLDALAAFRSTAMDPRPALGHVDWLTKKWMLDRLDHPEENGGRGESAPAKVGGERSAATWVSRKKVDIRYHELSDSGYFARLRAAVPEVCSVDPEAVALALRFPPTGSPALRRGQLIREFADGTERVTADWSHVVIGTGKQRRIVALATR